MTNSESIGRPRSDQAEQTPTSYAVMTQGQISIEMLVQINTSIARFDEKVVSYGEAIKSIDGKVVGVGREVATLTKTVDDMKADVKDLVNWKHKVWGMVIFASAAIALASAIWAFVSGHIQWKSDVDAKPAAITSAGNERAAQIGDVVASHDIVSGPQTDLQRTNASTAPLNVSGSS